jgi:hypothetical protein
LQTGMPENQPGHFWDVFISHASEDKESIARPLADALAKFGLNVWYDEFTLQLGDSLSRSIDRGLAESEYGIVILSPAFLAKAWPERELRGLVAREIRSKKVILPIWHHLTRDDVLRYSPPLADVYALSSEGRTIIELAVAAIEVIRPALLEKILRRAALLRQLAEKQPDRATARDLKYGPPRHVELPADLINRIRLIRAALLSVDPRSMDHWVDGFRGDSHPTKEVGIWERIASSLIEYRHLAKLTAEQEAAAYRLLVGLAVGARDDELAERAMTLPANAVAILKELFHHLRPTWDFPHDPFPLNYSATEEELARLRTLEDREVFPKDLPDELVTEWMRNRERSD